MKRAKSGLAELHCLATFPQFQKLMGDSHSSDGPRGGGRPNRSRSGGGNRNRNRNRNREGGGGGNRKRQGGNNKSSEWKPSGGRAPRKPEPKPTFFQKLLSFFGLGKKKPQSSKPSDRKGEGKSGRKDRPKRERKPLEVTSGRLFIGNIDYNGTEEQLAEHFAQVGEVKSAEIVVNPHNGKPKGFAFVEMGDIDQAKKAVEELNDKPFLTRNLLVSGAKSDGAKKGRDRGPRNNDRGQDRERGGRREGGDRGGRSGGRERGGRREKREHSDSKEPAMKPIEIEQVSGPGLRLENLNPEFSEEDLRDLFEGIGKVDEHHIDSGYTLVQMSSTEEAQKAVEVLHAKDFMGKRLKVIGAELESAGEETPAPAAEAPAPAAEAPVAESEPEEVTPNEASVEEPAVEESANQEDATPPKEEN